MKLANMIRERISNLQGEIGVYFYDISKTTVFLWETVTSSHL